MRATAPGRVNLIGEHTDYNGGFVLPVAIPQRTIVELAARDDSLVRAWSDGFSAGSDLSQYRLGEERRAGDWLDYLRGVTLELRRAGQAIPGFELRVTSDVPVGSGLASSAALQVALLRGLRSLFSLALDDLAVARLAQRAENELVGAPVGIMDQMAAVFADERTALFLDTRTLDYEPVPLPAGLELAVIHSGIRHQHAGGEYRSRRQECERAAELLGLRQLRDIGLDDLQQLEALSEPLNRRVRHVVTENARVLAAREALLAGDLNGLGAILREGHVSLRDDFEVSTVEIDLLVNLACLDPDAYGARHPGGFGGSVVILARHSAAAKVAARTARIYGAATGRAARVIVPRMSS